MTDPITRTDAEWRCQLTELEYKVTRQHGTERAFSHDDFPDEPGIFHCICCDAALFDHAAKFESGTGWPSFFEPAGEDSVEYETDSSLGMRRTEVKCTVCGSHLGHVFEDGPEPTGKRYCINSVAIEKE